MMGGSRVTRTADRGQGTGRRAGAGSLAVRARCCSRRRAPAAQTRVLDDFESVAGWTAQPADGVEHRRSRPTRATAARCASTSTSTAAAATRSCASAFDLDLPANYASPSACAATRRRRHLEFKLIDSTGRRTSGGRCAATSRSRASGRRSRIKKRQIAFAWGPAGGGELRPRRGASRSRSPPGAAARARSGSTTSRSTELPPPHPSPAAGGDGVAPRRAARRSPRPGGHRRRWGLAQRSERTGDQWLAARPRRRGASSAGSSSTGSRAPRSTTTCRPRTTAASWTSVREVSAAERRRDSYVPLPETEARFLRLVLDRACRRTALGSARSEVQPLEFGATPNDFFAERRAGRAPRPLPARVPRASSRTGRVVGVDGADTRRSARRGRRARAGAAVGLDRAVRLARRRGSSPGPTSTPTQSLARRLPADPDGRAGATRRFTLEVTALLRPATAARRRCSRATALRNPDAEPDRAPRSTWRCGPSR